MCPLSSSSTKMLSKFARNLAFYSSVLLAVLVHLSNTHQMCKETKHGVDTGLIRMPDFQDPLPANVSCVFSYSAQLGKRLLVKIDSVHLPPSDARESTLKLILDDQVIDIPRNCVRNCLKHTVSGRFVQILYTSSAVDPNDLLSGEVGSFQIRYKSFDPSLCDKPRSPKNGFVTIQGRKLGQEATYHCKQPYELMGKSKTTCQVPSDTPVPDWTQGPPKCVVPNCTGVPFFRSAGSGAISSPGYPTYRIESPLTCEWVITADRGYQIASFLTFMELNSTNSSIAWLRLYDGPERTLLAEFNTSHGVVHNRTTQSNVLTVTFATHNVGLVESGFFLEYSAIPGACGEPEAPKFGQIVGYSFGVGSTVAFRCIEGYSLEGNSTSECREDGTWSSETPVCSFSNSSLSTNTMADDGDAQLLQSSNSTEEVGSTKKSNLEQGSTGATTSLSQESSPDVEPTESSSLEDVPIPTKVPKPSKKSRFTSKVPIKTTSKPKDSNAETTDNETSIYSYEMGKSNKNESDLLPSFANGIGPKTTQTEKPLTARESKGLATSKDGMDSKLFPPQPSGKSKDSKNSGSEEMSSLMLYSIIGGSVAGLLILIGVLTTLVVYRKRFPVRMRFGRKFSTFENPMYSASKDQDAQHPRELKRLNPTL